MKLPYQPPKRAPIRTHIEKPIIEKVNIQIGFMFEPVYHTLVFERAPKQRFK